MSTPKIPLSPKIFTTAIIVIALLIGVWLGWQPAKPPLPEQPFTGITIHAKPLPIPPFSFVDHTSKPFDNSRFKDKWSLLFFGYTHCPDICQTTLTLLNRVYKQLAEQQPGLPVEVVFMTVDPHRDTPKIMADYTTFYNPKFIGVVPASIGAMKAFGEEVGIIFDYENPQTHDLVDVTTLPVDSKYLVTHNSTLFIVNPEGKIAADIFPPHNGDNIAKTVNLLAEAR